MPSLALTLNSTLLVYQPKRFIVKSPEGSRDIMEEGNVQGSSDEYGFEITAVFGPWFEALQELRTRRGGLDEVRVQYTDPASGAAIDRQMLWEADPDFVVVASWLTEDLSVTWRDLG